MEDPYNNVGRHCDVLGVDAGHRSWCVESFVRDGVYATYWLVNEMTGMKMRANLDVLTNLW